jgi:Domain of unknown function (DUF4440)
MKRLVRAVNVGALLFCAAANLRLLARSTSGDNSDPVAQADRAFVQAFEKKDAAALKDILDAKFIWIDSNGRRLSRAELLKDIPPIANSDVATQIGAYSDAVVVRANRGRMNVLRIWVKRATGWRAMLCQEVLQVEKSEPAGGETSVECVQNDSLSTTNTGGERGDRLVARCDEGHGGQRCRRLLTADCG